MKNIGVRRIVVFLTVLVVALFGLSVLAPVNVATGLGSASASPMALPVGSSSSASSSHASAPSAQPAAPAAPSPSAAPAKSAAKTPAAGGPHPGELQVYEYAPGGAPTIDPAVAYYTVDDEVITNTYESLIAFNGTQTGPSYSNWTPEIATCVPGSPTCASQFGGSTLVYNNASVPGQPQYYTFEIDAGARFYDPATGVSWPVYPSDVLFSFARTFSFADLPFPELFNGWINAQAILPPGNPAWDGAVHAPYNNTPSRVLTSILVNDSAYCPTSTVVQTNGCVTFNLGPSGLAWPYFLELVSDPLGGAITPCGAFTYVGAGLPGFLGTKAPKGDGPCLLPGNSTSSTQTSFTNYVSTVSPTLWDPIQTLAETNFISPQTAVQYYALGSGPYYVVAEGDSGGPGGNGGYTLAANPAYAQPVGCAGQASCLPAPGKYIPKVVVFWMTTDTVDLEAMISGQADTAWFDPSHTSTVLQLVNSGSYGLLRNVSSASNWFQAYEENFSIANSLSIDPVGLLNVPDNFFGSSSLREFLVHAYPYTTIQNTVWTVDGVVTTAEYGGAIPPAQVTYYPTNISWPTGNPDTNPADVGGAAWWWAQATNPSSVYYDSQLAACTSATPCQFPFIGTIGAASYDSAIADWISEIKSLTGGAIVPYSFDITGSADGANLGLANGNGNEPTYPFGWVPDYADPSDYMAPMWLPNGTFSAAMATGTEMYEPEWNSPSCGHNNYTSFADLVYWANLGQLPEDCSGVAFQTMVAWANIAAHNPVLSTRALEYNLVEHIGNEEAFMTYVYITVANYDYGSWLSPTGIQTNAGQYEVQTWWTWVYASNVFNVYFNETGLPSGTSWSATYGGVTLSSTTASIDFTGQANGTHPYTVTYLKGYAASPANGTLTVSGANVPVAITFTAAAPTYSLTFTEGGLVSNTTWTMIVASVGAITTNYPTVTFYLPAAAYNYVPGTVIGYSNSGPGTATITTANVTVAVSYTGLVTCIAGVCTKIFTTYSVTFNETGLPSGTSWSATIGGLTLTSTTGNITFYEMNGTYSFTLGAVTGYTPPARAGQVAVVGANVVVSVPFATPANSFVVTFTETGLPTGSPWNVTVGNFGVSSTTTTVVFAYPNGTYDYSLSTIGGYTTTWTGSFTVNGSAVAVAVKFVPFTYPVTFFEGGLPTGTSWNVTVNGATVTSTTYFLTVDIPNGTYAFTVGIPKGYVATPPSGNVTVSAAPATQVIIFSLIPATYTVTFTETGLPAGSSWTVYFNGASQSGTGTSISFSAPNGTWTYAPTGPSGYSAAGGSVTISGAGKTVPVTFTPTTTTTTKTGIDATTGLSTLAYALIGLFVVLTIIFLVLALMWRGRKPPMTPPQTWTGTTTPETPAEGSQQSPPPSS